MIVTVISTPSMVFMIIVGILYLGVLAPKVLCIPWLELLMSYQNPDFRLSDLALLMCSMFSWQIRIDAQIDLNLE